MYKNPLKKNDSRQIALAAQLQRNARNAVSLICPNPLFAGGHRSFVFAIHSKMARQLLSIGFPEYQSRLDILKITCISGRVSLNKTYGNM